jgi:hypothetical protein
MREPKLTHRTSSRYDRYDRLSVVPESATNDLVLTMRMGRIVPEDGTSSRFPRRRNSRRRRSAGGRLRMISTPIFFIDVRVEPGDTIAHFEIPSLRYVVG